MGLNVTHVVSSIDKSTGGPARSVTQLISQLLKSSTYHLNLYCNHSTEPILDTFIQKRGGIHFAKQNSFGFSKNLSQMLQKDKANLYHGHGLWQFPVHQMSKIARKKGVPYVITPRGMLEPWSLSQKRLKKKIAFNLFQKKDIKHAACIHVTADFEADNIRKLGFTNPIAIIPNGINLTEFNNINLPKDKKRKTLLFLSRIHPKKGIETLIMAWSKLNQDTKKNWEVKIAGNGNGDYIKNLNNLILAQGLQKEIEIIGPQFSKSKMTAYQNADIFVLPTFSENFGIVVAEALAVGVPVITTKGAPWNDLEKADCGWWIDIGVDPLVNTLKIALKQSPNRLSEMGRNGQQLIKEKYSIEAVSIQMIELYKWILEKGETPNFVIQN